MTGNRISDMTDTGTAAPLASGAEVPVVVNGSNFAYDLGRKLGEIVSVVDYVPVALRASVADGTNTTDLTSYFTSAIAAADRIHIPAGTYKVTQINIPANKTITTDGFDTVIAQASGQASATYIIRVNGSNVSIGDLALTGNISTDSGEFMHAIYVTGGGQASGAASLQNITIGNIKGTNIRGDVLYLSALAGYTLSQVRIGNVIGANIYRNVVSIIGTGSAAGGGGIEIASISGTEVGFMHFDIEPDSGGIPVVGVRVGSIKGRYCGIVPAAAAAYADGIEIGTLDLDPDYTTGSTPAYAPGASLQHALEIRNCKSLRIGKFRAEDFNGQAIRHTWNAGELSPQYVHIGHCELIDCCKTETTLDSYIAGTLGVLRLSIEHLTATTTLATHYVMLNCDHAEIGVADITLVASSNYMRSCEDSSTHIANITGGETLVNCTDTRIEGGTQNGEYLFNGCTRCIASNSTITMSSSYDNAGTNNSIMKSRVAGAYNHAYTADLKYFIEANGKLISYDGIRSRSSTAGMGYEAGAGGTVVQATSKSTGVTLNKITGQITMNGAALAASTSVSFTLTNSAIAATDIVIANISSGATADAYVVEVTAVAAGSCRIQIRNESGGSLSEAVVLNFAIIKGVTA